MKRIMLFPALAIALVSMPFLSDAQQQRGQRNMQRDQDRIGARFLEELNLTDAQKDQMKELRFQHLRKLSDHRSKVASARIDLQELIAADEPNRSAIEKKTKEIAELEAEGKILRLAHWFEVNQILQPEQQKVWKKTLGLHMSNRIGRPMMRGAMMRGPRMGQGPQGGGQFQ